MYAPTKEAAHRALIDFAPQAGRGYAAGRNYDHGPDGRQNVSQLSPWIRIRLLPEWEVVRTVLETHSAAAASKFIDEVCWRTYWKGWLQLRPSVWDAYRADLAQLLEASREDAAYLRAVEGRTGIECFDGWADELVTHNYLHNHARMWYASIWIHTLKLPWQLGADWFLRHLLDGDPASNTLSWRWVAGLHTLGKTYLARADNICKYTGNRFPVSEGLANQPLDLQEDAPRPATRKLMPSEPIPSDLRLGLLVTEEDLSAHEWLRPQAAFAATAAYFPKDSYQTLRVAPRVVDFRQQALSNVTSREVFEQPRQLLDWAVQHQLQGIATVKATTGHWPGILAKLQAALAEKGIKLFTVRHWWDEALFPHATHGFFRFKKAIPNALEELARNQAAE